MLCLPAVVAWCGGAAGNNRSFALCVCVSVEWPLLLLLLLHPSRRLVAVTSVRQQQQQPGLYITARLTC
uniref:Putative secreted protein n=1 Tax=Anopheles triannulatus TaxID=58253 RepID=A0A2M4B4C4_9DIPT